MENDNNIDIEEGNAEKETKDSEEKKEPAPLDQIGSDEFYKSEKKIEDVDISVLKDRIKAETVKKEEIYEDRMKKQEAFIESLGRKKEQPEENSENSKPKYVEEKPSSGKKIALIILTVVILAAAAGGGYWFWSKKKQIALTKKENRQEIVSINPEPEKNVSETEPPAQESERPALADPAKIKIKVLNEGAAAGSAGKAKNLLVSKGYAKAEAGNGELDSSGSFVYYSGLAASQDAEAVNKILSDNGITAKIKEALTSEQKSADIVVILGK